MKLDEIITTLSRGDLTALPVDALQVARQQWPDLLPVINELIQTFIAKETLTDPEANLLFFGICLIVDRKQFSCFDSLINLTNKDDCNSPLETLLGDFIGSDLSTAYYILAQGKPEQLCRLINSELAGEIVKMAALSALFSQLHTGQIDKEALNQRIPDFIENLVANNHSIALFELVNLLISNQFNQYHAQMAEYVERKVIDEGPLENQCIIDWNNNSIGYSEWESGLISGEYDIIDSLSQWAGFNNESEMSDEALMAVFDDLMSSPNEFDESYFENLEPQQPFIKATLAGRNDPCPCGSGKKYKKCCLN
ncbi:YecA family protein [Shewanella sp. 125m-7]